MADTDRGDGAHPSLAHMKPSEPQVADDLLGHLINAKSALQAAYHLLRQQDDRDEFFAKAIAAPLRAAAAEVADYADTVRRGI